MYDEEDHSHSKREREGGAGALQSSRLQRVSLCHLKSLVGLRNMHHLVPFS